MITPAFRISPTFGILATVLVLHVLWPSTMLSVLRTVGIALVSILGLVMANLAVLYVYIMYFVPASHDQRHPYQEFRPLSFAHRTVWPAIQKQRSKENARPTPPPFSLDSKEVSEAFDKLVSYILRDFIDYWFVHVAGPTETSFRNAVEQVIRSGATRFKQRLHEVDLFGLLVNRLVPRITAHMAEFKTAEMSLRGRSLERSVTQSDELDLLLASQFRNGRLHSALTTAAVTTRPTEVAYLRQVVEAILPLLFDEHELKSSPVAVIIREMVTCALLQPVFNMISDPDFWNQTIDSYLDLAIREQKMVRKLREVLNRHSNDLDDTMLLESSVEDLETESPLGSATLLPGKRKMMPMQSLTSFFGEAWEDDGDGKYKTGFGNGVRMGRRTFQEFVRMIEEEKNLLELKRARNDIVTQIRKKRAQIHDRDPEEVIDGEKVEDVMVYVNRLSVAKKRADKRIATLTGENYERKNISSRLFGSRKPSVTANTQPLGYSLYDILTNSAGLSYFMEFMERRGDMVKLQFWLTVEGFKSSDEAGGSGNNQTFLQDVKMVNDMYFSKHALHPLSVPEPLSRDLSMAVEDAQAAVHDDALLKDAVARARKQLYQVQHHLFVQIEKEHFPYFKRSDLYFKYLASTPNTTQDTLTERRSLDENRLFRRPSNGSSPRESPEITPRPLERTTSAGTAHRPRWSRQESRKAGSDDEGARRVSVDANQENTANMSASHPTLAPRTRHHNRTASESGGRVSRFLGLDKMVESANEWFTGDLLFKKPDSEGSQSKRPETTNFTMTEEPEAEDNLSTATEGHDSEPMRPHHHLLRSNTLDAVEAELQSIIDGQDEQDEPAEPRSTTSVSAPSTPTKQRPTTSPLLLVHPRGTKSSMAMPIQNDHALSLWTSSGGPNTISHLAHDEFDPFMVPNTPHKSAPQETNDPANQNDDSNVNVHLAPPGDLMLASKVEKLSDEMNKLMQQEAIVDALIEKAETRNKLEELRILKKSKNMLRRELQQIKYQKSQYELQESENVLTPDRTKVSILSSTIGSDASGEFALYVIEIQQLGYDGNYASGWIVARRYSEFFALHQHLKDRYPVVRMLDFPARWSILRLQRSFVEARRVSLERYLRRLIEDPEICESNQLRAFLSQQNLYVPGPNEEPEPSELGFFTTVPRSISSPSPKTKQDSTTRLRLHLQPSSSSSSVASNTSVQSLRKLQQSEASSDTALHRKSSRGFMKHIYKTVAEGIDELSIGPSMLDLITQRLGEQVMDLFQEGPIEGPAAVDESESKPSAAMAAAAAVVAAAAAADLEQAPIASEFPSDLKHVEPEAITKFTEPLCDLFIEMFELKEKNNWLRRQAVIIILQQILGGTIERKLRETVRFLGTDPMQLFYIKRVTDSLWPEGRPFKVKVPRRPEEKLQTKEAANRKLSTWLPDLIGHMVGRQNSRRGARRLFTVLQNKRLNQDLVYTLFDEVVAVLFPELHPTDSVNS